MSKVYDMLEEFVDALRNSDEYKEYRAAKDVLDLYPDKKRRVNEFREQNFEMHNNIEDPQRLMDESDRFEQEYEELNADPNVHRFMESELAFVKLMQRVYDRISETIDLD